MMKIVFDEAFCKGCNLCIEVCPKQVLSKGSKRSLKGYQMPDADAAKCVVCRNCEAVCPEFAISVCEEG